MKKVTGALAAFLMGTSALQGATLLPNGEQQFIDANGNPYANGRVYFYSNYPTCTILKNTWQDSAGSVLNTNPVILSAAGRATIFGSGNYCQVLKDASNNTIWTKFTADTNAAASISWGGTGTGTGNAQTVSATGYSAQVGQIIYYQPAATNTGPATLNINGIGALAVVKPGVSGYQPLVGGELAANTVVGLVYTSAGNLQLITNNSALFGAESTIPAATTTNLTSNISHNVNVSGSGVDITSFGTPGGVEGSANSIFFLRFSGSNKIVYNATSMKTPNNQDIFVAQNDVAVVEYISGANWRVAGIIRASSLGTVTNVSTNSYTVTAEDAGATIVLTYSGPTTVTLPAASSFNSAMRLEIRNSSPGYSGASASITPTSGTINGQSTFLLTQNYGIKLIANGTNWEIAGPAQQVIFNGVYPTTSGTSFTIPINNPGVTTRKITVVLTSVGIGTVTDDYLIQIGNSTCSSFKTSGYESSGTIPGTRDAKSTTGFIFTHGGSGSSGTFSGLMTIFLANPDPAYTQYTESYTVGQYSNHDESFGGGTLTMSSSPFYAGCIKLTTVTGTTAFASGVVSVFSE